MTEIRIFYKKASDFKVVPVSGAWGGVTPQGYVHCELFHERAENPESVVLDIGQQPPKEIDRSPQGQMFIRESMVGLAMHPEIARSVGRWLISKADEYQSQVLKKRGGTE
jgi:hypothetical protein